mmetsp:Transcript_10452/g.34371  ORF Transcript_10452/g.34371 Transcript_10452/m.34371 type:complete len:90 (-) Transcript_10452:1746-2015(-)
MYSLCGMFRFGGALIARRFDPAGNLSTFVDDAWWDVANGSNHGSLHGYVGGRQHNGSRSASYNDLQDVIKNSASNHAPHILATGTPAAP